MKILKIIIFTFAIAIATSALYELDFFANNPVRYALLLILILLQLAIGYYYIRVALKSDSNAK